MKQAENHGEQYGGRSRHQSEPRSSRTLVVGVGASAGGLDAFKEFLEALRGHAEFSVVFIQHLDPSSEFLLPDLLKSATDLKVVPITGRKRLKPGHLYVAPPKQFLEIRNQSLRPKPIGPDESPITAIDHFFHSLASEQGEDAVGVVLSGAGSDGTVGLKAISDSGGLTFAQDAASARFDSMPRSAATTGVADHVCRPNEIARELVRYAEHLSEFSHDAGEEKVQKQIGAAVPAICEHLLAITGHNFQHYKISTLTRRIQRRMQILKIPTASEYLSFLQSNEEETRSLFRELLIGVTAFFRDPEAFGALSTEVIPKLFANKDPNDVVRIWTAGCSTGEEAYSLAMLCQEHLETYGSKTEFQIFATDIDERALQTARSAVYPSGIEDDIQSKRLKRFFVKRGKKYQLIKSIRDRVLFSKHNLISDPPFSRLDLIACRNLLIYLGPHLQEKLIPLFHYALRPSGFLFLGPSETISSHGELFRPVDGKFRISQRKSSAAVTIGSAPTIRRSSLELDAQQQPAEQQVDLTSIRQRILLDEFAPKAVVIDQSGQVLNASDGVDKYLAVAGGDFQNNIIKMAVSGLRIGLRAAINEATKTRRKVTHENLSIRDQDRVQRVMLTVQPMPQLGEDDELLLVVFHDVGKPVRRDGDDNPSEERSGGNPDADRIIAQMERELETTRSDLERTLQDMEAANEELKSSNEELLSMNEELQSANEELETSKEEIRSTSESVARSNNDLKNLLRSTKIATVFLDQQLRIRSYTPAVLEIYSLIPTDVGRPLERFVPHVKQMPPLPKPDEMRSDTIIEHQILADTGKAFIRRVLPYQSHSGKTDGVVVTFTDVTQLSESEELFQLLVQASAQIVWITDADGLVREDSPSWREFTGQTVEQWMGRGWADAIHPDDRKRVQNDWGKAVRDVTPIDLEYRLRHHSGAYRWSRVRAMPQRTIDGNVKRWVGMNTDIHEQKQQHLDLIEREAHLRRVIDGTLAFIGVLDPFGNMIEVNEPALQANDLTREQVLGRPFWETGWWSHCTESSELIMSLVQKARSGQRIRQDALYAVKGGEVRSVDFSLNPIFNDDGEVSYLVASGVDIEDRKNAERDLADAKTQLDLSLTVSGIGPWHWDMNSRGPISNPMLNRIFGFEFDAQPSLKEFLERIDEPAREQVSAAVEHSLKTGTVYDLEHPIRWPSGEVRYVRARGSVRLSETGEAESFFGVVIDITDRKRRELALAEREAHLRRVINNQIGLVGVIDRDGKLLEVDERSLAIAKSERDDVIGKHFADTPWWNYSPEVSQRIRAAMEQALAGEMVRFDVSLFSEGSQGVMIDFMIAPVFDEQGEVEFLIPSGVDIRDRKRIEQQQRDIALRLEAIFNTAVDGIITIDRKGIINSVNVAASKIFGYPPDEMIGRNVSMLMSETDRDGHDDYLARYEATGKPHIIGNQRRVTGKRSDGSLFPLDLAVSETPLDDQHRYVGILRDISDRVAGEQEIWQASRRMEMALRAGGMAAWEWTPQESFWTEELYELLAIDPKLRPSTELFFSLVHPDDLGALKTAWQDALDGKSPYECEFRIIRGDGQVRWLVWLGEVVRDEQGNVARMYGLNWDSTREHLHAERLRESERRAKEASATKSEFLANMSHEIRTPMTAILGYTDLLQEHIDSQIANQHLETIRRNGDYLLEIINDILDLSKIEAGKLDVEREHFEPARTIDDVRGIMEVRAREEGLALDVQFDGELPRVIESDSKRLKQILINLVGNAIKFTREGNVTIRARHDSDASMLIIEVSDTGIGMNRKQLNRLFKPFSQGDASVSREFGGTGLGLAISQRLARLLGGEIEAVSTPGVGSTFTVSVATGSLKDVEWVDYSAPDRDDSAASGKQAIETVNLDCHILVVDDRRDIRFLSKHIITKAGGLVTEAEDGLLGIDAVKRAMANDQTFDLILLDMQMPNLDGYQTARQLRQLGFSGPIIALTADAMQGNMSECIDAGCNDFLSKPIDKNKLLEKLRFFLGNS